MPDPERGDGAPPARRNDDPGSQPHPRPRADGSGPLPDEQPAGPGTVRLVGTGHVFPLRQAVQDEVFDFEPQVVALELDSARLQALLTPEEDRPRPRGLGYGLLARFQQKVAKDFGGSVGDEMLAARDAAMLIGCSVALIDRPVQETYRRLMQEMSLWERVRLIGSALLALVPGPWLRDDIDRVLQGDPTLVEEVGTQYPSLVRVLLHERNEHMTEALKRLATGHERILVVLGDAHVPGVESLLRAADVPVEVVRLSELTQRSDTEAKLNWRVEPDTSGPGEGPE